VRALIRSCEIKFNISESKYARVLNHHL